MGLANWFATGLAKDAKVTIQRLKGETPEALGKFGRALSWTGHRIADVAVVPLLPFRAATKIVSLAPKTSAVIGLGAAGATAYSALSSHHKPVDFTGELQNSDMVLQETAAVQQPMQMQALQQMAGAPAPTYQMQESMIAEPTGPGQNINYLSPEDPTRQIMAPSAELHGPLMAQQKGVAQGAIH